MHVQHIRTSVSQTRKSIIVSFDQMCVCVCVCACACACVFVHLYACMYAGEDTAADGRAHGKGHPGYGTGHA